LRPATGCMALPMRSPKVMASIVRSSVRTKSGTEQVAKPSTTGHAIAPAILTPNQLYKFSESCTIAEIFLAVLILIHSASSGFLGVPRSSLS
jgi:hypothetical protein